MKKVKKVDRDYADMRREYDLATLDPGVRGKHYARLAARSNLVRIAPEVHAVFPNERAVNAALRRLIRKQVKGSSKSGRSAGRAVR